MLAESLFERTRAWHEEGHFALVSVQPINHGVDFGDSDLRGHVVVNLLNRRRPFSGKTLGLDDILVLFFDAVAAINTPHAGQEADGADVLINSGKGSFQLFFFVTNDLLTLSLNEFGLTGRMCLKVPPGQAGDRDQRNDQNCDQFLSEI